MKLKDLLKDFLNCEISQTQMHILKFPEKEKNENFKSKRRLLHELLEYKKVIDDLIIENHDLKIRIHNLENKIYCKTGTISIHGLQQSSVTPWKPLSIDPDIA